MKSGLFQYWPRHKPIPEGWRDTGSDLAHHGTYSILIEEIPMRIIALSGLAGSGKSTVAACLAAKHGFVRVRFADPLKTMLRAIGLSDDEIEGDGKEKPSALLMGKTPRLAMQTLGTEWGRQIIGPDFWTGLWERTVCDVLDQGGKVVTEDCRFPNEAAAGRKLGGIIWRIEHPGLLAGAHLSERALQGIKPDAAIVNDGSLGDLALKVEALLP